MTIADLAHLVNVGKSVIEALELADYEGDGLAMLVRVASAHNKQVEVHFVHESSKSNVPGP